MKILVLSDSHGNVDNMARCVEMVNPRHILHLGDCIRDAEALAELFPEIPMTAVPGNCDWGRTEQGEVLVELAGRRILLMHGHTHYSMVDYDGTLYIMNPGSIGDYHAPTYGVITVEGSRTDCSVYRL